MKKWCCRGLGVIPVSKEGERQAKHYASGSHSQRVIYLKGQGWATLTIRLTLACFHYLIKTRSLGIHSFSIFYVWLHVSVMVLNRWDRLSGLQRANKYVSCIENFADPSIKALHQKSFKAESDTFFLCLN